jgi:hypothetical protein
MTTPTLLIESRDGFGRSDGGFARELALALARDGVPVTLLYVNNGVLGARRGARGKPTAELAGAGVTLLADAFSLAERGIDATSQLAPGVAAAPLDIVIAKLAAGWRVVWH